jgi:hypothetical protein
MVGITADVLIEVCLTEDIGTRLLQRDGTKNKYPNMIESNEVLKPIVSPRHLSTVRLTQRIRNLASHSFAQSKREIDYRSNDTPPVHERSDMGIRGTVAEMFV